MSVGSNEYTFVLNTDRVHIALYCTPLSDLTELREFMPTAPVDDTGNVLYYEDSGVSEDLITYPTVVLIHGGGFHGGR